jgi:hypothetical protein
LAANSLPPLTADANRHRVNRTQPGNSHAALNAAPIADTAPAAATGRSTEPPSTNDGNSPSDSQQCPHRARGTKIRQHRPARTQRRYPDQKHIRG